VVAVVVDAARTRSYYYVVLRRVGVLPDDVDDVLQEARIRHWRAPSVPFPVLVKRAQ